MFRRLLMTTMKHFAPGSADFLPKRYTLWRKFPNWKIETEFVEKVSKLLRQLSWGFQTTSENVRLQSYDFLGQFGVRRIFAHVQMFSKPSMRAFAWRFFDPRCSFRANLRRFMKSWEPTAILLSFADRVRKISINFCVISKEFRCLF